MEQVFDTNHAAVGAFFYGREKELEFYQRELFTPASRGLSRYFSVTGMKRIGKTSLFRELCRRFRAAKNPNVIVLEASLDKVNGFWPFWIQGVLKPLFAARGFAEMLSQLEEEDAQLLGECRAYFLDPNHWRPLFEGDIVQDMVARNYLERLFPVLYDAGKYVILIIDEFDKAEKVFGKQEENFGWFRGLLQDNMGLSVVTLSRRSIRFIEKNCFGGSTFDGIFSKRGLFGYSNSEMDAYFMLLKEHGLALEEEKQREIWYYCGRSPFYLAIMGQALLQDPMASAESVAGQFVDSFEAVLSSLKEEKLLNAMLQMFVGPRYRMSEADVQRLAAMGYCMKRATLDYGLAGGCEYADYYAPEQTGEYLTVCGYFIDYLREAHRTEADAIWPMLTATEQKLRKIIEEEYRKLYPGVWKEKLEEMLLNGVKGDLYTAFLREHDKIYQKAGENQQKSVGNSILNVVNLKTLSFLIRDQWGAFCKYFSCSCPEFVNDMDTLYEARNPITHSNGELLTPADISAVETICTRFAAWIDRAAADKN